MKETTSITSLKNNTTHELIQYKNGTSSLKHKISGETMHSFIGPWDEARLLYIEQSRLAERIILSESQKDAQAVSRPLVLFDMGLGAAANALAVLDCYEKALMNKS